MTTVAALISETAIDIVAAGSLVAGATYRLQNIAATPALAHRGGASPPTDASALILRAYESVDMTLSGDPVWLWTSGGAGRVSATLLRAAEGPLRDRISLPASTDYSRAGGFIAQVEVAGNVRYRTKFGSAALQQDGLTAGAVINVGGIPVELVEIIGTQTTAALVLGVLS